MSTLRPNASLIVRPDLALVAAAAISSIAALAIADMVLPPVPVQTRTGQIFKIPTESILSLPDVNRERGSGYNRVRGKFTIDTYMTEEAGIEEAVFVEDVAEYGAVVAGEGVASTRCRDIIIRAREKRVADTCINESTWTAGGATGKTVGTAWSSSSATPAADVDDCATNIFNATGVPKDQLSLVIPLPTFNKLAFVTDFITKMKLDSAGLSAQVTPAQAALYFGVKEVLVAKLTYNTAKDGQPASVSTIWNKNYAFLFLRMEGAMAIGPSTVDMGAPGLGCSPRWELMDAGGYNAFTYGENQTNSDIVRVNQHCDEKIVHTVYANLIKGIYP